MGFKIGDRVIITGNTNSSCNKVGEKGTIVAGPNHNGSFRVLGDETKSDSFNWTRTEEMKLTEKTMEDLKHGDIIIDGDGREFKVVYANEEEDIVAMLDIYDKSNDPRAKHYSYVKSNFTIKGEVQEFTLEDIAGKLGIDVKSLRIKE